MTFLPSVKKYKDPLSVLLLKISYMPPIGTFPRSLGKCIMSPECSKMSRTSPREAMSLDETAEELEFLWSEGG